MGTYIIVDAYYLQGTVFGVLVLQCPGGEQRKWMSWDTLIDELLEEHHVKSLKGIELKELPSHGGFADDL